MVNIYEQRLFITTRRLLMIAAMTQGLQVDATYKLLTKNVLNLIL